MKIVGCDLHTRYQQIAILDRETGELVARSLPGLAFWHCRCGLTLCFVLRTAPSRSLG